jgi:hypothetical protein
MGVTKYHQDRTIATTTTVITEVMNNKGTKTYIQPSQRK